MNRSEIRKLEGIASRNCLTLKKMPWEGPNGSTASLQGDSDSYRVKWNKAE